MAYSYTNSKDRTYYLHRRQKITSTGKTQTLYFFRGEINEDEALDAVPDGYAVSETKNGMLVLKKTA